MQLTMDSMDGTEGGSIRNLFFFPVERYVLWATYKDFGNQGLENQFGNQLSVRKQFSFGPNSKECANLTGYSNVQTH